MRKIVNCQNDKRIMQMYDRFIISFLRALKEQEGDDFGILNNQKLRFFFFEMNIFEISI